MGMNTPRFINNKDLLTKKILHKKMSTADSKKNIVQYVICFVQNKMY